MVFICIKRPVKYIYNNNNKYVSKANFIYIYANFN